MKKTLIFTVLTFIAISVQPLFAEEITFSANKMSGTAGNSSNKSVLTGNAHVKTETMEIFADTIELSGKDFRRISAEGNVKGLNLQNNMEFTCSSMKYDRETEIATLENGVHLVDSENDVTADAEIIEYNQKTDIAVMQIQVSILQKDNNCTAAYAIYRKNQQILEMTGNPKIVQGKDTFRAQDITLNLETQEITLDGRVKGSITTTKEQNSSAAEKPSESNTADLSATESSADKENSTGGTDEQ